MKPARFNAKLTRVPAQTGWYYIPVPGTAGRGFEKRSGSRRVICELNGRERFQCALIPSGSAFMIIVNKARRERLGIAAGDKVSVSLEADDSKYGMPMPAELREVLKQDRAGSRLFHSLTPGKQRSMLYYIGKQKDVDRRIRFSLVMIEHLKANDGELVYGKLGDELKRVLY